MYKKRTFIISDNKKEPSRKRDGLRRIFYEKDLNTRMSLI